MTLQSHSWTYIQIKPWSERIHAPQYSLQHHLQKPTHTGNLNDHRQMNKNKNKWMDKEGVIYTQWSTIEP